MFHFSYRVRAIRWPLPYDRLWLNETKPPDPPAGNGPLPPPIRTPEELQVQKIPREQSKKFALNWQDEPLLRVSPGESFEIETWDASTGFFQTPEDKAIPANRPGFDRVPPLANPIGGPVYLEGAQRGDTLVVTVEDILVADFSWTGQRPGPRPARRLQSLARNLHRIHHLYPQARTGPERYDPRRHHPLQRPDFLARDSIHRNDRRRAGQGSRHQR